MAEKTDELIDLVKEYLLGLSGSAGSSVGDVAAQATKARYLTRMPEAVTADIRRLAETILGGKLPDKIIVGLSSSRLSERIVANDAYFELIARALMKGDADFDAKALERAIEEVGPEALVLIPHFADSYRRHIAATGKNSVGTRKDLLDFFANSKDRVLKLAVRTHPHFSVAKRQYRIPGETVFSAALHSLRSSGAERTAVVNSLHDVFRARLGDVFFKTLFAKIPNLIPAGDLGKIKKQVIDILESGKLPDELTTAGASKLFLFAHRSGLQGMLGELLVLPRQVERAKKLSEEARGPVYILLGTRLDSVRTMATGEARKTLNRLPGTADVPDKMKGKHILEASVEAVTREGKSQEFTDGLIGALDGKGGFTAMVWTETKVGKEGVKEGLTQFDRNHEDIDEMVQMVASQVIKVEGDKVLDLSLNEAAKVAGAKVDDAKGVLVFTESDDLMKRIAALEDKLARRGKDDGGIVHELAELRKERKLSNFKNADKELYVGIDQKGQRADWADTKSVEVEDFGHGYSTLVDAAVLMLANLGLKH